MKGHSLQENYSVFVFLRRSLIVAALVASLLSALIPFSAASSVHLCTMECCAGTAPHLAGACSTGLLKSTPKQAPEPEVLCGLNLHRGVHRHLTGTRLAPRLELEARPPNNHSGSCGAQSAEAANQRAASETTASRSPGPPGVAAPSISSPCNSDCGTCLSGSLRQPKPREPATLALRGHGPPPNTKIFRVFLSAAIALHSHHEQPQPRGPPISQTS